MNIKTLQYKNTLTDAKSTRPFQNLIPPKNPGFNQFQRPTFHGPKGGMSSFRQNQNRGSGGK